MKGIKNILVPTDFSVTARNAFHYAKHLAEVCAAEITVLHVNEYFLPLADVNYAPLGQKDQTVIDAAMAEFVEEESMGKNATPTVTVNTLTLNGDPVTRLLAMSEQKGVDLILMGTTGLQDLMTKIIGSTSFDVANKAHCPVMLIPRDAKWKTIDNIMFSTTYAAASPKMVQEVAAFARIFKSKIDFVHVDDTPWDEDTDTDRLFDELLSESEPDFAFDIHNIKRDNVVTGLKTYAERKKIDVIAFVSKRRNFWQNLMHKSVSENVAISTHKPMLILHYDDKE